ncbi:hypothetical protein M427DRAFT_233345 [Gonapodya prolifera JEL478]|uniref:Uncharacterized protein n=1 Tax=Gonapodya prolifera (strain JEL478) TaxID=1344416 RepID=A0A138ZXZ9_GONPJ|nr:hypothetical protein M427DRAFT_233345 [Gonapodya prolifera JEL478]|eukprot:KXS09364.1 hypothetical protein M427DRAFT_233345 [Gonapodya prolifera JEL478]
MDHPFLKSKEYRDESQIVDNCLIYFLPGKRSKAEAAVLGLASKSDLKKYTSGMAPPDFVPAPSSRLSNMDVKRWRESQANAFRLAAYLHEHPSVTMNDVTSRLVTFTLDGSIEDNRPNAPPKPVNATASVPSGEPIIIVTAIHPSAVDAATLIPNVVTPKRTAAELEDASGAASSKRIKIDTPEQPLPSPRLKKDGTPYRSRSRKTDRRDPACSPTRSPTGQEVQEGTKGEVKVCPSCRGAACNSLV